MRRALTRYIFEEFAAHGVLNATFVIGVVGAAFALLVALSCPPPAESWRLRHALEGVDEPASAAHHRDE